HCARDDSPTAHAARWRGPPNRLRVRALADRTPLPRQHRISPPAIHRAARAAHAQANGLIVSSPECTDHDEGSAAGLLDESAARTDTGADSNVIVHAKGCDDRTEKHRCKAVP